MKKIKNPKVKLIEAEFFRFMTGKCAVDLSFADRSVMISSRRKADRVLRLMKKAMKVIRKHRKDLK